MKTNENFQLSTFNFQTGQTSCRRHPKLERRRALMEEFPALRCRLYTRQWADVIVPDNGSTRTIPSRC